MQYLSALCLALLLGAAAAHMYGFGQCPNVQPLDNFEEARMLGKWYVTHNFQPRSKCLNFNFTSSDGELKVVETKQLNALDSVGLEHQYRVHGDLEQNEMPGSYEVKFVVNRLPAEMVVMDTDYDNYAGVYHCQDLGNVIHRRTLYIMSRQPTIEDSVFEQVRSKMTEAGLNPRNLKPVSQEDCTPREESDININFDGSLFNLGEE